MIMTHVDEDDLKDGDNCVAAQVHEALQHFNASSRDSAFSKSSKGSELLQLLQKRLAKQEGPGTEVNSPYLIF